MVQLVKTLSSDEAASFHDCHVRGISWDLKKWSCDVLIDYIVEWIAPTQESESYSFRMSPAVLRFLDAHDIEISLNPTHLDAQIDSLSVVETAATPNGTPEYRYKLDLHEGTVYAWSTGYEVHLLAAPVPSRTPRLDR